MPARAYWKGHLRLSLVTIGIELYSAAESANRLSLHQIHKPSGKRIRYEKVAPGVGPVPGEEIVKGFEVDRNRYVTLEDEELDAIRLESKRTIDLVQFVDYREIDPRYYEKPYYVVPQGDDVAAEGFAVIREALRQAGKVGLGQMATRGRDQICAVKPCGDGLLLEALRYADEVRDSDRIFATIPDVRVEPEMLELATELIQRKAGPFEPEKFTSQYSAALRELIEEKRRTGHVSDASDEELSAPGGNVVDLMDALRRSVARGKSEAAAAPAAKTRKPAAAEATKRPPRRRAPG
jgi:DNA end-binding protein Ku